MENVKNLITDEEKDLLLDYFYSIYSFSEATELTFRVPNDDSEKLKKMKILGEKLKCINNIKEVEKE